MGDAPALTAASALDAVRRLCDPRGIVVVEVKGFTIKRLEGAFTVTAPSLLRSTSSARRSWSVAREIPSIFAAATLLPPQACKAASASTTQIDRSEPRDGMEESRCVEGYRY